MRVSGYAIPAVNCVSSSGINACLEAARANDAPIIIQFSSGGSQFYGGKCLDNSDYRAAIAGAVSGAFHTRTMAEQYGIPVILHTDHCSKQLLPWVDGLIAASERYYKKYGEPLFSSHMIDLSEEPLEENLKICQTYLERMDKIGLLLEMELGITGGEEDGVDNSDRPVEDLYSKPEEIFQTYEELGKVSDKFTVAAAFGNVHGVYSPGNVKLDPKILDKAQKFISEKIGDKAPENKLPVSFVFHGGSGSDVSDIQEAIGYGVIKMNIDTDTQWSYWEGIKNFEEKYHDYLQGQIGNPEGEDKPNKKYYDVSRFLTHHFFPSEKSNILTFALYSTTSPVNVCVRQRSTLLPAWKLLFRIWNARIFWVLEERHPLKMFLDPAEAPFLFEVFLVQKYPILSRFSLAGKDSYTYFFVDSSMLN